MPKKAWETLVSSDFISVADKLNDIIFALNLKGRFVFVNRAGLKATGYKKTEILNKRFTEFMAGDSAKLSMKNFMRRLKGGKVKPYSLTLISKQNDKIEIEVDANPIIYDGKVAGVLGIARNITEKKRTDDEIHINQKLLEFNISELQNLYGKLAESEEKYRSLFDNMLNGFAYHKIITDKRGKPVDYMFLEINDAFEQLTGLKRKMIIGKPVTEALPGIEKDPADWIGRYGQVALKGKELKFEQYAQPLGRWYSVLAYSPEKGYFATIFEDITDRKITEEKRKESEKALSISEERYRMLFESAGDAIFILEAYGKKAGNILAANKSAADMHGYTVDELLSMNIIDVDSPADAKKAKSRIRRILKGKWIKEEIKHRRKDGTVFPIEISAGLLEIGGKKRILAFDRDITERKKVEDGIRKSEERYRTIFENVGSIILIANKKGRIKYFNKKAEEVLGFTREYIIGKSILRLHPTEDHDFIKRKFKEHQKRKFSDELELPFKSKSGKKIIGLMRQSVFVDSDGEECLVGMVDDITEQKKIQEALKLSEIKHKTLIQNIPGMVYRGFSDWSLEIIRGSEEICGYTPGEINSKRRNWLSVIHSDDRERIFEEGSLLSKKPKDIVQTYRIKAKDGSIRWVEDRKSSIFSEKGKFIGIDGIVFDITERKKAEERMLSIKNHLETIINAIGEGMVVIDRNYKIASHNAAFVRSLRRPSKDIIGKSCFKVIHNFKKSCSYCVVREMFKTKHKTADLHSHLEDGKKNWHDVRAYPLKNYRGELKYAVYIFADVSKRMDLQEKLEENYKKLMEAHDRLQELDKMKSEFVSIASHELQTPLSIIRGYADLLSDDVFGKLNPQQKDKITVMTRNINSLIKLVNDILDLSRIESGQMDYAFEKVDLGDLISEVVSNMEPVIELAGLKVNITIAENIPKVKVDFDRMSRVISNLIDNSIKFTPSGGSIIISLEKRDNSVLLRVKDNGVGIPEKEINRVFESFFQVDSSRSRKYKGTGLGLTICKKIVEAHGGVIAIESKEGRGTTVSVTLPLRR